MIFSSLSVNQPFSLRNQLAVEVGLDGMSTNASKPTSRVRNAFEVSVEDNVD